MSNVVIHCPACSEEIDHLHMYEKREVQYDWYAGGEYDECNSSVLDDLPLDFECPECQELLFHDEEIANKFMTWGDMFPWEGVDDYGQNEDNKD